MNLLTLNHPLIGDYVSEGEPELEEEALKKVNYWVDHSKDNINERTTGLPFSKGNARKTTKSFQGRILKKG